MSIRSSSSFLLVVRGATSIPGSLWIPMPFSTSFSLRWELATAVPGMWQWSTSNKEKTRRQMRSIQVAGDQGG
jgi:hypothetical protein